MSTLREILEGSASPALNNPYLLTVLEPLLNARDTSTRLAFAVGLTYGLTHPEFLPALLDAEVASGTLYQRLIALLTSPESAAPAALEAADG